MSSTFTITLLPLRSIKGVFSRHSPERIIAAFATLLAIASSVYSLMHGYTIAYGDAESHLNIAKRVIDSVTPGFAQLGGIWLPLPHILLIPFVWNDWLWRTGVAASIVSGIAYVVSSVFLYKLAFRLTSNDHASYLAAMVFMLNPNILYLQSTPMTELPLIVFFILSSYYFIRYMHHEGEISFLIASALFGFCASLSRYDGWALVVMQAGVLFLHAILQMLASWWRSRQGGGDQNPRESYERPLAIWETFEGRTILYATLAFFGIALWFVWGWLILGDPLYFTHSQFSANSQQQSWLSRGELPAYRNIWVALEYYLFTSAESAGSIIGILAVAGLALYVTRSRSHVEWYVIPVLFVPFFFNVLTLYLGQSVIFLPGVTPPTFEWTLFNVRYGTMMIPAIAVFIGCLFAFSHNTGRWVAVVALALQSALFVVGFTPVLSLADGMHGLSSAVAKIPDAQYWLDKNYDHGILLTDDFARTISIVRSPVKMENVIYIGNKPYWEESLIEPQKYARWIVVQKEDDLWKNLIDRPEVNARLYKYFNKVYTSEDILIFRKIDEP